MFKIFYVACVVLSVVTLSACSLLTGDTASGRKAFELAVDCKPDEALKAVEQTGKMGGLAGIMAEKYQHEAILREAGRNKEADELKAARDARTDIDQKTKDESEKAVINIVDNIRKEREKRTGSTTCKL